MSGTELGTEVAGGNTKTPATTTPAALCDKYRNYCFTSYNGKIDFRGNMKYLLQGEEVCPETGRDHIQGFVIFKNPRVISGVIKEFKDKGCHWEICRGNIDDNIKYCKKDEKYSEEGEVPAGKGFRTDVRQMTDAVKSGASELELVNEFGDKWCRNYKALRDLRSLVTPVVWRTEMTRGIWYYGETGKGKSHMAFEGYHPDTHYVWTNDKGWWDNYNGHEFVIMNDFRGELKYNQLLQILDKWPHLVSRRGKDPIHFVAKTVIITSPQRPEDYYGQNDDDISQLLRRVDVIKV